MAEIPKLGDDRPVAVLTVAELRAIVRDEVEATLGEARGTAGLLTVTELGELLRVSERTIATLRGEGLPTVWVTPDSPRFDRAEALAWCREVSAWVEAGQPVREGPWTDAWLAWVKAGCRGPKPE